MVQTDPLGATSTDVDSRSPRGSDRRSDGPMMVGRSLARLHAHRPDRTRGRGILRCVARSLWTRSTWVITFLWLVALLAPGGTGGTAIAVAAVAPAVSLEVSGSPLRADPPGRALTVRVTLSIRARLRVRVTDFERDTVRSLLDGERRAGTHERRWGGRDRSGRRVPIGAYRIEATATPIGADAAPATAEAWVTVANRPIYPADPGVITVVVDPGHGGPFDGAVAPEGTREADLNLDIGLRLARMLEGAGVNAVVTRESDRPVNWPPVDRTFDGVVDVTDDLAARADRANAVRADLFIAVHNNFAVDRETGGPSTYHSDERTFRERSARLARLIQDRMVEALEGFRGGGWEPYDHGVLSYPYYVLRDYDPPRLLRPTRMPGVLSEGLFLTHPRELRLLQQARVRQAMANAYYEAIAAYLGRRGSHVGYTLVEGPAHVTAGGTVTLEIEVRDQGTTRLRGWRLEVGAQPAGSEALARSEAGTSRGGRGIPVLRPGEGRRVRVTLTAPTEPGLWVLMVDALDRTGAPASRTGSPMLHVPLLVMAPPARPPRGSAGRGPRARPQGRRATIGR